MSKPRAPTPPNPNEVASAQTGTNVSTAIANTAMGQVNQVTPDGSLTYSATGNHSWTDPATGQRYSVPQYTATTQLSPEAQAIRDQNNAASLNLATLGANQSARADDLLSTPFSADNLPAGADRTGWSPVNYGGDLSAPQFSQNGAPLPSLGNAQTGYSYGSGQEVQDALMQRIEPQRQRDYESLQTRLAGQGIGVGTAAYDREMQNFERQSNDNRLGAVLAGGQEQSRQAGLAQNQAMFANSGIAQNNANATALFGMGEDQRRYGDSMAQQNFGNQQAIQGRQDAIGDARFGQQGAIFDAQDNARSRSLQEQLAMRNQPINEITALMSGSQVQTPQFGIAQSAQIPTTDYAGITQQGFNNQQANYQQQNANWQQTMGGLFGLGRAAIMSPSDIRLKADIEPMGQRGGHNWYSFRYVWDEPGTLREGVMAQEVMQTRPDAVLTHPLGFLMVDYDKLGV